MEREPWIGRVVQAAALVDYQDRAIVSRTLIKERGGSVTLFAFDRDQELSEHSVPHAALVWVLEGQADLSVSGEPQRVSAGEMVLMPAGAPHAVKAAHRFKMLVAILRS